MTGRTIRAARRASLKRTFGEPADFDMPEPLTLPPAGLVDPLNDREPLDRADTHKERKQ